MIKENQQTISERSAHSAHSVKINTKKTGELIERGNEILVEMEVERDARDIFEVYMNENNVECMKSTKWVYRLEEGEIFAPNEDNIRKALYANNGNLLYTCLSMGWDGSCKSELYRWVKKLGMMQDLAVARDQLVDKAERVVVKGLEVDDVETAKFVLKTQGRYRGWSEKEEEKNKEVYNTIIVTESNETMDFGNMDEAKLSEFINNKIRDGRQQS